MPVVLLAAAVWIVVVASVLGLCRATSQSEAQPAATVQRRHAARPPLITLESSDEHGSHAWGSARPLRRSTALASDRVA
jgi:hypothetical protein